MKTNNDFREIDQQASEEFAVDTWSETCQTCNGLGEVSATFSYRNLIDQSLLTVKVEVCPNCDGIGEIHYERAK